MLATVLEAGLPALRQMYGSSISDDQWRAVNAVLACRTGALGHTVLACASCDARQVQMRSCGHRSCPRCQHHTASAWLERQQQKLLPVDYFMVTFTLPAELRGLAARHPRTVFDALFDAASQTLLKFGLKRKQAIRLGLCAVLHTHSRRLDFHPHVHVIVPGGGLDVRRDRWRAITGQYLFPARSLAKVFRAKMLARLAQHSLQLPVGTPTRWVVNCKRVGSGLPAIKYLSRYLYRGVIAERDIVRMDTDAQTVTFRYQDSKTKVVATRTLAIAQFLRKVLMHVLPKGFRRVRDYGFLHGNAVKIRVRVQVVLRVVPETTEREHRSLTCDCCGSPMMVLNFVRRSAVTLT